MTALSGEALCHLHQRQGLMSVRDLASARECQIVIFTCVPERYAFIGEAAVVALLRQKLRGRPAQNISLFSHCGKMYVS